MSLTFQLEPVRECWQEVMVLAEQHWAGTKSYRRHMPFNPSRKRYLDAGEIGFFQLFTARDGDTLVGYFGCYLTQSMHSQHWMLTEDTLFLHPDYRKGRNAIRFIKHIEAQARTWGVVEILFSCESDNAVARRLLEYLDYQPVIMQHSKLLQVAPPCADSATASEQEHAHVGHTATL
jgi:GNAT superfamily N-acetyltransferase